ncbi:MAG: hypothetical protein ACQXXF_02650 [Thermoplasmatota archaeon]|jgi:hypothetical protein
MKKMLLAIGICSILVCMPLITSSPINVFKHKELISRRTLQSSGTFEGIFAEKNETGYNILGNISGTYTKAINWSVGTFSGIWAVYDENVSGEFNGNIFHKFFIGQYNVTDGDSGWLIGLFKLNQTTNEFRAISIVFAGETYLIRYALGTYIETY